MKKILALLLCCVLVVGLFAACQDATTPTESETDHVFDETAPQEEHNHNHVNYKGLTAAATTLEDVVAVEGREADFSFEANGVTYYAFNNVTMDGLSFSQVQYSFGDHVRISCTSTTDDPAGVEASWNEAMTALYGAPSESDGMIRWADHTGNFITLTQLNEDTVQLCFYLVA